MKATACILLLTLQLTACNMYSNNTKVADWYEQAGSEGVNYENIRTEARKNNANLDK